WRQPGLALGVLAAALALLAAGGTWLTRRGVLDAPMARAGSVNLEAVRGAEEPRVWLVAHLDSKSQPVPMALRVGGVVASALALVAAATVAALQLAGSADAARWWPAVTVVGILATLPVVATTVGARSPGALDDASGVATVLAAAALLPPGVPVGVLLPSAEELGLAGARAWSGARRADGRGAGIALNVDGVDDGGVLTAMWSRRTPPVDALIAALTEGAAAARAPFRDRRLVPGILTDHVALADAGWTTLTLSRGTWRTLSRIHTARDSLDALDGAGAVEAARVLASAVARLVEAPPHAAPPPLPTGPS
ncbi:MAG TPA: M28 family peptidase, partial [Gemmatirosa sp.]|nr:M28 family peptidase [Gemmatirosa sp.]